MSLRFPLILALALGLMVILATAMLRTPATTAQGVAHPEFTSMNQGGQRERHNGLRWIATAYGAIQFLLFATLISVGIGGNHKPVSVAVVSLLMILSFAALMVIDGRGSGGFLFGFPIATVMVGTVWAIPWLYVLLYVANFRRWIYGPDQKEQFAAIKRRFADEIPTVDPSSRQDSGGPG